MTELELIPATYSVCRLAPDAPIGEAPSGDLHSVTRTLSETSIVCRAGTEPAGATIEPGWRTMRVSGPLDFTLIGVLAELTAALAGSGVGVFTISTYETDYLLVKEEDLARAVTALEARGHDVGGV